ncbi:membrane-bound diguanylate cyclase [Klebsiella pneumoniae]|uniref:Membrane-bound diguanylate cyclase n=1 Tax=Klebsiella pneumoniae TaxID=573 RepID=A0A2X3F4C9_KLEPN|nr:membrane-bound diguanylate cyclase [Klebsiella pneumoniae]
MVAAVVDSAQQGYLLAEKIRHGVESQPFGLGQNPIHLTISLGLETPRGRPRPHHRAV